MKEVYQAPVDIAAEKYPILEVVYRRKRVRVESLYQMFPEEHVDEYIAVLHRLMLVRRSLDEVLAKVIQANSLLNEQFPTISIRFLASHGDREMLHDLVAEHAPDMVLWTVDSKSGEFAITTKEIAREAMKAMDHLNAIENSASRLQQMICSRQKRCGHTFRHSAFDTETGL